MEATGPSSSASRTRKATACTFKPDDIASTVAGKAVSPQIFVEVEPPESEWIPYSTVVHNNATFNLLEDVDQGGKTSTSTYWSGTLTTVECMRPSRSSDLWAAPRSPSPCDAYITPLIKTRVRAETHGWE